MDYGKAWNPVDGFAGLKLLLNKTDFLIVNLEGTVTDLPIPVDLRPRDSLNYSFSMDPRMVDIIKDVCKQNSFLFRYSCFNSSI